MTNPTVLILAGGRAMRMGGRDKALQPFGRSSLLGHVLARLDSQAWRIVLNANGDPTRFARFGLPVLPDTVAGHPGPLAGVLAGMEWTSVHTPDVADIVTVPTDSPFLPRDLIDRLLRGRAEAGTELACAASGGRLHPVAALWPVRLAPALRRALVEERMYRVRGWTARFTLAVVDYPANPFDPFLNVNTPAELAAAEALLPIGLRRPD